MEPQRRLGSAAIASDIATASNYARRLVEAEADQAALGMRDAVARVASRLKVSFGTVWGLLYAPPKSIGTTAFRALQGGVRRHLELEIGRLTHELYLLNQSSVRLDQDQIDEVEAHLNAARRALGRQ